IHYRWRGGGFFSRNGRKNINNPEHIVVSKTTRTIIHYRWRGGGFFSRNGRKNINNPEHIVVSKTTRT
ncbi:hypothetical protein, partial [Escherichia coli]|uniref:hypothetical protein n=1 Tax=Escherichia coli TaxID=562 RepID=UPI001BC896E9